MPIRTPSTMFIWLTIVTAIVVSSTAGQVYANRSVEMLVYIGTYTRGGSQGIYVSRFDVATGALSQPELAAQLENPSFLAIAPDGKHLYAVGELSFFAGKPEGAISAFAIDAATGGLKLINQASTGGSAPCHLVVDRTGRTVLIANYGGGSVASRHIKPDGSLGDQVSFHQHQGSSVNPQRQQEPHAHSVNLDRNNHFAMVADLGKDQVLVYIFDSFTGQLAVNHAFPYVSLPPGSGPRHFAFHPNGKLAFVINEMKSTLTCFDYDDTTGQLTIRKTVSTLPEGFAGNNSTAEVVVHPNGRFVYGSNRGHHSIAVFSGADEGDPQLIQNEPTGGSTPRNFAIDPTGTFLLAENQDSNSINVFRIDADTGRLTSTGHQVEIESPVCVKFLMLSR